RRDGHVALTDGDRGRLAGKPRLLESLELPLGIGNQPGLLVVKGDAGLLPEAERACPFGDLIDAQFVADLIKIYVARLHDAAAQIDRAVTLFLPVAKDVVAERERAGTAEVRVGLDRAFFERGEPEDDLEGRPGRVLPLDRAVVHRMRAVVHIAAPFVGRDAAREDVGIELRRAHHREHRAAAHVERDDRAFLPLHRLLRGILHVAVDGQDDIVAGHVFDLVEDAHAATERVDLDLLPAGLPTQIFLPAPLQARLANLIAHAVAVGFLRLQLARADLAQVADQVRRHAGVEIVAARPRAQRHSR